MSYFISVILDFITLVIFVVFPVFLFTTLATIFGSLFFVLSKLTLIICRYIPNCNIDKVKEFCKTTISISITPFLYAVYLLSTKSEILDKEYFKKLLEKEEENDYLKDLRNLIKWEK